MAKICAVTVDLFFAERLERALTGMGHDVRVVDLSAAPAPAAAAPPADADLAIVDLEAGAAALEQIRAVRQAGIRVLAFGPHVDVAAQRAARDAGARVVTKSQLTRFFAALVAEALG